MSHKLNVLDLERGGEISLTQQLVDRVAALIDGGGLEPGEKLPATRALAEDAGINHLTAVRVYRRLAELGYVTAAVGRGTFVRQHRPTPAARENDDWQLGMLAPRPMSYADEMLHDLLVVGQGSDEVIPLASGFPDPTLCPSQELADAAAAIARDNPRAVSDYLSVEGLTQLRERLAELGRESGFARSADELLVTTGARQGIDLVSRAVLGPGDVALVESPTFAGTLASMQATGARVLPVPVDADGLDVEALERILARLLRAGGRRLREDALRGHRASAAARVRPVTRHLPRLDVQDGRWRTADRLGRRQRPRHVAARPSEARQRHAHVGAAPIPGGLASAGRPPCAAARARRAGLPPAA